MLPPPISNHQNVHICLLLAHLVTEENRSLLSLLRRTGYFCHSGESRNPVRASLSFRRKPESSTRFFVIPAKAGIQYALFCHSSESRNPVRALWIPAFAGMTLSPG